MGQYRVENKTDMTIWWRDGAWTSGDLLKNDARTVDSDHNADVTMFGKDKDGDHEWGRVWILLDCTLVVTGDKSWCLKPN